MIDLGYYTLLASLVMCSCGSVAGILGGLRDNSALSCSAKRCVHANFFLLLITSGCLSGLIFTDQFSVRYVASYSSRNMPLLYKLSAFWGGQEGSLLFWALALSLFSFLAVIFSKRCNSRMVSYLSGFLLAVMAFFAVLIFFTGNPFALMERQVFDGQGLNPLLQNWYMVIHPPTLFFGFAGVAIPFAFALAALADGFRDKMWLRIAGYWAIVGWVFLTIGITLGGRWAYEELGWGGYWAWDPVENASLLPWLMLTAFLHSIMLYERKGSFRIWSFVLLLASFELTIFGTFITRSGVLSSVHAFGNSSIGPFLLWFIIITTLLTLGWMVYRKEHFKHGNFLESFLSREASFVLLNWILALMTLAIFCGTVMPAISELITGRKVAVGAAFYNQVSWPLALVLLLLIGVSTLLAWKKTFFKGIQLHLSISVAAGILAGAVLLLLGIRQGIALAFFSSAAFVITAILGKLLMAAMAFKRENHTNILVSTWRIIILSNRLICSSLVHVGVVMVLVGIISSSLFNREETFMVREGDVFRMEGYTLTFKEVQQDHDELKDILTAEVEVIRDGRVSGVLRPQKHFHHNHEQPMTEIALEQSLFQDLYLILYGWDGEGNYSFRIIINPLIRFIWWGVCLMCLAVSWRFGYRLINTKRKSVSG
jgi:cytochrome c-type biogenesis protein CcmF